MLPRILRTPHEQKKIREFSFERMKSNLDDGNRLAKKEQQRVFARLPLRIVPFGRYPAICVEHSEEYSDSIALTVRLPRRFFFVPYTHVISIDLSVHRLTDLADELEFFAGRVVAGDSFVRVSDSGAVRGTLVIRCESGVYTLESSMHRSGRTTHVSSITCGLFQMQDLIKILRGFDIPSRGWKARHFA